ncbi:MAG: hypothetical protein JWQ28_671 [Pedobacter sp.]|jgi:ABC-type transport system involved in multi-copper enzyme maturation permease subunit|nr:hypothetical protein [Pedobacter sp.]
MLFHKYWLETRTRFYIGILVISALCLFFVLGQPWILKQWALDEIRDPNIYNPPWIIRAKNDFTFFIWRFLYNNLLQLAWVLLTIMLAIGGISQELEKGTSLFTLSLPVTRFKLFSLRILVGFLEAVALALLPVIIVPLFSALIGQDYSFLVAVNHAVLFITGGLVFYSLGILINTLIKSEATAFFISLGMVIVYYFLFQPYSEGMHEPRLLKYFDLPAIIGGNGGKAELTSLNLVPFVSCCVVSFLLLLISYYFVKNQDFNDK